MLYENQDSYLTQIKNRLKFGARVLWSNKQKSSHIMWVWFRAWLLWSNEQKWSHICWFLMVGNNDFILFIWHTNSLMYDWPIGLCSCGKGKEGRWCWIGCSNLTNLPIYVRCMFIFQLLFFKLFVASNRALSNDVHWIFLRQTSVIINFCHSFDKIVS